MKPILDYFKEIVSQSKNPVVIEIGACDGYHTNLMIKILQLKNKPYEYHVFEPNKDLQKQLTNNIRIAHSGVVKAFEKAVGNSDGIMTFYKSGGYRMEEGKIKDHYYGSSSIRKPKLVLSGWKDMTFEETFCDVVKLDTHIKEHNLEGKVIDFVYMDSQGAEIDIILGGKEAFNNQVKYFYTEYCDSELYEGEIPLKEILSLLPNFEIIEDYGGDVLLKNKNIL